MTDLDELPKKPTNEDPGNKEFLLFSSLTTSVADSEDLSLVNSGASRHMPEYRDNLTSLMERRLSQKVELGDNNNYVGKVIGNTSIELESGDHVHLRNILYVPSLKKNLVSISCLEDKGDRVAFVDGKFLIWTKGSSIDSTRVIEVHEGRFYRILKQLTKALVHSDINPCEIWHKRYAHLHYRSFPTLKEDGYRCSRVTYRT